MKTFIIILFNLLVTIAFAGNDPRVHNYKQMNKNTYTGTQFETFQIKKPSKKIYILEQKQNYKQSSNKKHVVEVNVNNATSNYYPKKSYKNQF